MKIDFEREFNDYILRKGYDYYLDNKVCDVSQKDDFIIATVKGTDNYKVALRIDDDSFVDGGCSCPYSNSGKYCKHMAALLYYLNENDNIIDNSNSNNYDLKNIINNVDDKKLRKFIYDGLMNDSSLLNKFRVEFSDNFPKLSKKHYENKIYNAISNCSDGYGFIDYNDTYRYRYAMYEYTNEAKKLVEENDYQTAFNIVTIILDSIPDTGIDDSDGSTSMVADDCIDVLLKILEKVTDKSNSVLKEILDYVIEEVKTANLYNYGIDLKEILKYYVDNKLYLSDIGVSLEKALDSSRDKSYFYNRYNYIEYLIRIYKENNENDKIITLLEKYSFDEKVCMMYVDELVKMNKTNDAIKVLKDKIKKEDSYVVNRYAKKLSEIYWDNKMIDEYKENLYGIFCNYPKYDIGVYCKIKKLYSSDEWNIEKKKIIDMIKKDDTDNKNLNKIYIEEEMFDELFKNVCNHHMRYIEEYDKYLLPKYKNEILEIYKKSCLIDAEKAKNRKAYRDVAVLVNHVVILDNGGEVAKSLLKEIDENYFRNRPAMKDEFRGVINKLSNYIE